MIHVVEGLGLGLRFEDLSAIPGPYLPSPLDLACRVSPIGCGLGRGGHANSKQPPSTLHP